MVEQDLSTARVAASDGDGSHGDGSHGDDHTEDRSGRWRARRPARRPAPSVELVEDGGEAGEASGMATMLAELLESNLKDFPGRAAIARRIHGEVVLVAQDNGLAVTISFGDGRVTVRDGAAPSAPSATGPWLTMARLCSGQEPIPRALARRAVHIRVAGAPVRLAAAMFTLSVPESFYAGEAQRAAAARRRLRVAAVSAGTGGGLAVALAVARRRQVRRRRTLRSA